MLPPHTKTLVLLASLLFAPAVVAQVAVQGPLQAPLQAPRVGPDGVVELQTMVVSGVQPGPGMWKVRNGANVLWVMGTLSPLPKAMTWLSRDVEAVVGQAQEVIRPPAVSVTSDLGRFRQLLLLPSILRARKNPEGRPLEEVLPPDLHARWTALKLRHLGRGRKFERWRPVFAGFKLYQAALDDSGLAERDLVNPVVDRAAKRGKVKTTTPMVTLKIDDPAKAIREFSASSLGDLACLEKTIARVESDLGPMATRANAWAIGDIETLRSLPYEDQTRACLDSLLQTELARRQGFVDLEQRVRMEWMKAAEAALKTNRVTFATLPIANLLRPDGYLRSLEARGYVVEQP